MTRTAKRVRCVCKNRDRHFGVCKCHRHKGDTVSDLPLTPAAEDGIKVRTDVWWCAGCNREWKVPSIPHNPNCPICGKGGWWRRFV